jgi:RNA polymerase sigma-70 factor (ECF subfamily)
MNDDVQELCRQAGAGDLEAASRLVALYHQRIFAYFARLCPAQDAEDLTEKTFFKAWTSLARFGGKSTFSTWLHSIAHHAYVDWRRKRNPAQAQPPEWWEALPGGEPSPFESVAARDQAARLYRLVDALDPDTREIVHLHYYQHLSIAEVSEALDIATSTVKYRLRQALDSLRARAVEPGATQGRKTIEGVFYAN